jgi:perosamine synthetase
VIPVNTIELGPEEEANVLDCVRSGWISSAGPWLERFETQWAAYCGRRFGIATSSGTTALQAVMASLQLEPGDEVIIPTFTIVSCALAVLEAKCVPVLVDADPRTWCMDPDQVRRRIGARTRAIMPVHIYGHPVDMDPILEIAAQHELAVVEDAAEAHGAEYLSGGTWRRCGSFGDASCFSFYANKLVTTGEGGMVVTDDAALAERLRSIRNLGFGPRRFHHEREGFNFRLTNLQAAIGVAQVARISQAIDRKRAIAARYSERFRDLAALELPAEQAWARSVYWMYGVVVREEAGKSADELARALHARGIETRPFFVGMHEQPIYQARGLFANERYPVAERLSRRGLYFPSGLAMTEAQQETVCAAVREILA